MLSLQRSDEKPCSLCNMQLQKNLKVKGDLKPGINNNMKLSRAFSFTCD